MKNRKLYESIQNLVTGRSNPKKAKRNFAQDYCSQQLKKKKLIPKASTSKIDDLMQNFKSIKTYIDVDDLIGCVNEVYLEEEKAMKIEAQASKLTNRGMGSQKQHIGSHKKCTSETREPKILQKAKQALKEYHKSIYDKQNQNVRSVVGQFELKSNYLCETMKNTQKYGFITEVEKQERRRKIQHAKQNEEIPQEKWNKYGRATTYTKTEPTQRDNQYAEEQTGKMVGFRPQQNYKKKKKMFELAQIYLQIVLQEEYRKKWNKEKECRVSQMTNYNTTNAHINSSISLSKKKTNRLTKPLSSKLSLQYTDMSSIRRENLQKTSSKCLEATKQMEPDTRSSQFVRSRPKQSRLNTKIIKYKEIAIRKLNNFLADLEEDEDCLKNENKYHLSHLSKLEKHFDQENMLRGNKIWRDEQKCEEIRGALQKQDGK